MTPHPPTHKAPARRPGLIALLLLAIALPLRAEVALLVVVEGVDDDLLGNVLGHLGIEQNRGHDTLTDAQVTLLHRRAPVEIRRALEPFGYYRAQVESSLERDDGTWVARYVVDPGEPVEIGLVDVELRGDAGADPAFRELLDDLPVREGRPLRHADYDRARDALGRLATERGYRDARFVRRELRIDLDRYVAEVLLTLESGERYRFGAVTFEQDELDEALLRRFLPFAEGDPYEAGKLLELQGALTDSDYFAQVRVRPQATAEGERAIPVVVEMTPRPHHRYSFGLGYGTDTGMRGRVGWEWRPVNRQGHRFGAGIELAEQREAALLRYALPVGNPRSDRLVFSASVTEEESDTTWSRLKQLGAALELGGSKWRQVLSLDLKREESETGSESQNVDLVVPGVNWSRLFAGGGMNVRRGHRLEVDLHGGSEQLGSDVSYGKLNVLGKHIVSPWEQTRLIGRWELGTTWTDDFSELPVSERYFAGGDNSIRGYAWRALGPENAAGDVVGGEHLAVGSLEAEHYFGETWGAAVFVDSGYAFDDVDDPTWTGAGVGLRWRTPIGTVRVDLAQALDGSNRPWRLHLVVGPDL